MNSTTKKIAFIGVPNVGKSSLINAISKKEKCKTGNWNGVTVAKKIINFKQNHSKYQLTDLPGIYNFNPSTVDEQITFNEIVYEQHDLYVQIADARDLETSLYLTMLLKELQLPVVLCINFADEIKKNKIAIEIDNLRRILKIPIIFTTAIQNKSGEKVINFIDKALNIEGEKNNKNHFFYSNTINNLHKSILTYCKEQFITNSIAATSAFLAVNENFNGLKDSLCKQKPHYFKIKSMVESFNKNNDLSVGVEIVDKRNSFTAALSQKTAIYKEPIFKKTKSQFFDKVILNRFIILPFFVSLLLISFILVFNFGTPYKNFLSDVFTGYLPSLFHLNPNTWYGNFLDNAVFNGIGTLITFVPIMYLLFVMISLLQQTGLINRLSFCFDRLFSFLGLNGKSIVPFVLGFGCNVASVYATRAIHDQKVKKATAMLSPFMSCSARIVVFSLFASIFFGANSGIIIFSLYVLGIFAAIFLALIVKLFTRYKHDSNSYQYIDLPVYQRPKLAITIKAANSSIKGYIKRASTIILGFTFLIWFLSFFPNGAGHVNSSFLSYLKYVLQPIFTPLGFGLSWILVVSIIPGIIAKETTVATIALLYGVGTATATLPNFFTDLGHAITQSFVNLLPNHWFSSNVFVIGTSSNLQHSIATSLNSFKEVSTIALVYSYMTFVLLTIPCITTLAAIRHEFGWKTTLQSAMLGIITPYVFALVIFQVLNAILM